MDELDLTPVQSVLIRDILPPFLRKKENDEQIIKEEVPENITQLKTYNLKAEYPEKYFTSNPNKTIFTQHLIQILPNNVEYIQYNGKQINRGMGNKISFSLDGKLRILHIWQRGNTEPYTYTFTSYGYASQDPNKIIEKMNKEAILNQLQPNKNTTIFKENVFSTNPLILLNVEEENIEEETEENKEEFNVLYQLEDNNTFEEF